MSSEGDQYERGIRTGEHERTRLQMLVNDLKREKQELQLDLADKANSEDQLQRVVNEKCEEVLRVRSLLAEAVSYTLCMPHCAAVCDGAVCDCGRVGFDERAGDELST